MRRFVWLVGLLCGCASTGPAPETIEGFDEPVAVVRDASSGQLFVTERDGRVHVFPADGDAASAVFTLEGEGDDGVVSAVSPVRSAAWIGNNLWVSLDRAVVQVDPDSRGTANLIEGQVIPVRGAQRLAAVADDGEGRALVADSRAARIHRIDGFEAELLARGLPLVSGLGHDGESLWVTDLEGVIGRWTDVGLADRVTLPGGLGGLGSPVFTPEGRMFVASRQARALLEVFPLKRPGTRLDSGEVSQSVTQRFRIVVPDVPGIGDPAYDPETRSLWVPSIEQGTVRVVPLAWIDG